MQVERGGVVSQRVLGQRRHTDDPSRLVHVLDPLLGPAQVGVGDGRPVAEIQLDVGPYGVSLRAGGKIFNLNDFPLSSVRSAERVL